MQWESDIAELFLFFVYFAFGAAATAVCLQYISVAAIQTV